MFPFFFSFVDLHYTSFFFVLFQAGTSGTYNVEEGMEYTILGEESEGEEEFYDP